jgi:2-dehydro-3-deoxyglucarate aldolase/4-hydroxy-2-oxoheptanedioate aldolase
MRSNDVKWKVAGGGVSIGTFVFEFNTTGIGRIAAEAGAEFAVFDMEHTGWSVETIRMLIATTRSTRMLPYVRVPATEYDFIARALDMGAMGIMVPMVESAEQAGAIVRAAKYPPAGRRGAAFGIAHDDYTGGDILEKLETANRETHLLAQIETASGVEHATQIAAVAGIDALWIGHFDLSISLGIPGQFNHPKFKEAIATVLEACRCHGKTPGFMAGGIEDGKTLLDRGFRLLAYGGDLWLYQAAVRSGVAALQEHAAAGGRSNS